MKCGDIQRLHDAGLITRGPRQKTVAHFWFKEDSRDGFIRPLADKTVMEFLEAGNQGLVRPPFSPVSRGECRPAGRS